MIYLIVGIVLAAALAGWLAWRNHALRQTAAQATARMRAMQRTYDRESGRWRNLQRVCDSRAAEIHRLKNALADREAARQELEGQASALNISLFRENGLRIIAEKEDGAKRLQLEQLERQVEDLRRRLRAREAEAAQTERQLRQVIAQREDEIGRIKAAHARRIARRVQADAEPGQISFDDILDPREDS